jgi:prenyltransferase beta subunit
MPLKMGLDSASSYGISDRLNLRTTEGFRYTQLWEDNAEGDVSITGWHTASLRSIRNAGFDVPQAVMDRIAAYITRNQNNDGGFSYIANRESTFTMTAAGTLCLALAGKHGSPETLRAATYLSRFRASAPRAFSDAGGRSWPYYGCYYQAQMSIQLGGQLWVTCMGEVSKYLLAKQSTDGLWPPDGTDSLYGPSYSTSMAIIALTPILQILPIYQR